MLVNSEGKRLKAEVKGMKVQLRYLVLVILMMATSKVASAQNLNFKGPFDAGKLPLTGLDETSGVVASQQNVNVLWTHNDSGDGPFVYGISIQAEVLCTLKIENVTNRDWEDIAYGPGPKAGANYLYVSETGDNEAKAPSVFVYRVEEPLIGGRENITVKADKLEFVYPDGPRDAEALIVDPLTLDIYIITKRERKSRIYMAKAPHSEGMKRTLVFVGELSIPLITASDISAKGDEILLKDYAYVYYWKRNETEPLSTTLKRTPTKLPYMPEPQGEAICFSAKADGYFTLSEREDTSFVTHLYTYPKFKSRKELNQIQDVGRPSISITPSRDTPGIFDLRYSIPAISRIRISLHNAFMYKIEDIEKDTREAGVQEREIDLIDKPDGLYIVILRTDESYTAIPVEVKH